MTTHVTIGSDSARDYQFYAPLTCLIWRERIGFHPILMKVGAWDENERGRVAFRALCELKIDVVNVEPMEGLEPGRTAQQCREMIGCLDLHEDDWGMPSDADLWPIRKSFYHQHQSKPGRVTSYYSNGDHYQTIPTCHVAAEVWKWREMYGVWPEDNITAACRKAFDAWFPRRRFWKTDDNFARWMADQDILTEKIFALPEGYEKIERRGHPPVDRLDRSVWPKHGVGDIEQYVDAHMPRPADQPELWPKVREVFGKLLPNYLEWADRYREAYLAGY